MKAEEIKECPYCMGDPHMLALKKYHEFKLTSSGEVERLICHVAEKTS